jgi:hypothetical protein
MLSWPNRKCYEDWEGCHRNLSRKIWRNMWIRTDDKGWHLDLNLNALWIGTDSLIMLSLHNLKCYVDWKGCDRELSRTIWSTMWIKTDDRGWCHDLIWGARWIRTNPEIMKFWPVLRWYIDRNRWYGMLPGPILKFYVDWNECDRMISRPTWSNMWIRTDDRWWCHDVIWGAL